MQTKLSPSLAVSITVQILSGSTEDLTRCAKPGQRRWWLQGPSVAETPWHDIGRIPGDEGGTFTTELVAGARYVLGTGLGTRVRFTAPM